MPVSQTLDNLNITDAIVTTKVQESKIKDYFPTVRTHIVSPSIKKVFRNNDAPRKLIVNIISKEQSDLNRIVKPFYWKNPIYKWVSFRDLRGLSQEAFAEALREAAITIWIDDKTSFGYSLLEDAPQMIASAVRSWTLDDIPADVYEYQSKMDNLYSEETQENEIEQVYVKELIERRLNDFKETKADIENNVLKTKED